MRFVYILESERNGRFYIGQTSNISLRLSQHNAGKVKATKYLVPWKIAYTESYESDAEARKREYYLKAQKSRKLLESLISERAISSVG